MTTDISLGVRWDPINQQNETINQDDYEFEYDGGNSSSRLFERSRIKALAGKNSPISFKFCEIVVIVNFLETFHIRHFASFDTLKRAVTG